MALRHYLDKYFKRLGKGFLKQEPDIRDFKYEDYVKVSGSSPPEVHIIPIPKGSIRNQGTLNSCTGFAASRLVEYVMSAHLGGEDNHAYRVSPLFLWHNAKKLHGYPEENKGVWLRYTLKTLMESGFVFESNHAYQKDFYREPLSYVNSIGKMTSNLYLQGWVAYVTLKPSQVKEALANDHPVVFGINLNDSFYGNRTGYVKDINPSTNSHAMIAIGYKVVDGVSYIMCENSWGSVGDRGYFYVPEGYFLENTHDLWTLVSLPSRKKTRQVIA